eukprot:scaffold1626_cov372-Prasinococcus_capsulatus_cf.AAC.24
MAIGSDKRAEIYTHEAPWLIYGMNWSVRRDKKFRLAIGSFVEEYTNKVQIITLDDETGKFKTDPKFVFPHPYPTTKIMFIPDKDCTRPDLVATTGDYLRVWQIGENGVQLKSLLNNVRPRFRCPLPGWSTKRGAPR